MTGEDKDEMRVFFDWMRERCESDEPVDPQRRSLRELLNDKFREDREAAMREEEEDAIEDDSLENPTPLMKAFHTRKLEVANWRDIAYILRDANDDAQWKATLHWRWPGNVSGPRGYSVLLMTAAKTAPDDADEPDRKRLCLESLYIEGILRGNCINETRDGMPIMHMAISWSNMTCLEALWKAEQYVLDHYPETSLAMLPDWAIQDSHGKTPLGHWIISKENAAKTEPVWNMYRFLKDRLRDCNWSEAEIRDHEKEQRKLGLALNEEKWASGHKNLQRPPLRKHFAGRSRSAGKRRRLDDGPTSAASSSMASPRGARSSTPEAARHPAADDRHIGRKGQGKGWQQGKGKGWQQKGGWSKGNKGKENRW